MIKLTNLDKLYWPKEKITKGDLVKYYEAVAPVILPYLQDRPENLNRHPDGITQPGFFQKDVDIKTLPRLARTVAVRAESTGEKVDYLVCNNRATLLYMINLGCIELNPWHSRVHSLERPDYWVLDLDPGPIRGEGTLRALATSNGTGSQYSTALIKVAQTIHQALESAGLTGYVKTSGQRGLHIYVPMRPVRDRPASNGVNRSGSYAEARAAAEQIARAVHAELPALTSLERAPAKRRRQIYLDYLQNSFGQTLAAPYSVRPVAGALVSTPLKWSEVRAGLDPAKFNIKTVPARLKQVGNLWRPVLEKKVDLK